MAEAQMWNNCSNNSCQIITLSQCHFEISAHSYFFSLIIGVRAVKMVSHYSSLCNSFNIKHHFKLLEGQGWCCVVLMSDDNGKSYKKG